MSGFTNWSMCPVDGSFGAYAAHDTLQQTAWRDYYLQAAEKARESAFYQAAQSVVIAGIQAAAADNAADKQYDIANRQIVIAEDEYARYVDKFHCNEHLLADQACAALPYEPKYEVIEARSRISVLREHGAGVSRLARARKRYCLDDFSRRLCDLESKSVLALAAVSDSAYRQEESKKDLYDDRNFNRAISVANLGRSIQAGQVSLYNSGASYAMGAIQTRLSGINNFLGALSGGISGIISSQLQYDLMRSGVGNSPMNNAWYQTPTTAISNYGFSYGGPAPLGGFTSGGNASGIGF